MPTGHSPSPLIHQRYAVFRLLKAVSITTGLNRPGFRGGSLI